MLCTILVVIAVILALPFIISKLTCGKCSCKTCLVGKTAIVTGGNSGIGFETALDLASRGCRVIIADRNDAQSSMVRIVAATGNRDVVAMHLDLASFASVRRFAEAVMAAEKRLDILVNNAGIGSAALPSTGDGLNTVMQVNYFGPFLLTSLLADLLRRTAPSRIVFTSSLMAVGHDLSLRDLLNRMKGLNYVHNHFWDAMKLYANSKLCNIVAAKCFNRKLGGGGVAAYSLHPGSVRTNITFDALSLLEYPICMTIFTVITFLYSKSIREGAQTTIHLALSNNIKQHSGRWFLDCKPFFAPFITNNENFIEQIWTNSEDIVGLKPNERITVT